VLPLVNPTDLVDNGHMFSVHCPRHGSEVLLSDSRIRGLDSGDGHLTMSWECWCGYRGTHRTGRSRRQTAII
jgi:hypothetical protein